MKLISHKMLRILIVKTNSTISITISIKVLKERAYKIDRNLKYDGYQRAFKGMIYRFFWLKKNRMMREFKWRNSWRITWTSNYRFQKKKVYARFRDNIWEANLAEMGSLSSKKRNARYLLCMIGVFTKYAWVKPLKDKKCKTIINDFIEIVNEL